MTPRAAGALAGLGPSLDDGRVMPLVAMTPHGVDGSAKPVASVLLETNDGQVARQRCLPTAPLRPSPRALQFPAPPAASPRLFPSPLPQVFEVESRVAFVSPAVCRGFDPTNPEAPVPLPNVSANALSGILEYCRFHTAPGRSAKESRAFDKKFAKVPMLVFVPHTHC